MVGGSSWGVVVPPSVAPVSTVEREEHWRQFDNSVNAVSFGFVATAILISMFLVMAVFERFLRPRSTAIGGRNRGDLEAQMTFNGKLDYPSPKMTIYAEGVSVLMPGEEIPTFIAHPVRAPCPPECNSQPLQQHNPVSNLSSTSISS
uniref:Uncharacterized protein n=1 Tax=Davidia involucrata TaxID=16924 RepID=A0A5B7B1F3_DAVIN